MSRFKNRDEVIEYMLGDRSDLHPMFGGLPNIRDLAYNLFMRGKIGTINDPKDPEAFKDWFNDTRPMVEEVIARWIKEIDEAESARIARAS